MYIIITHECLEWSVFKAFQHSINGWKRLIKKFIVYTHTLNIDYYYKFVDHIFQCFLVYCSGIALLQVIFVRLYTRDNLKCEKVWAQKTNFAKREKIQYVFPNIYRVICSKQNWNNFIIWVWIFWDWSEFYLNFVENHIKNKTKLSHKIHKNTHINAHHTYTLYSAYLHSYHT